MTKNRLCRLSVLVAMLSLAGCDEPKHKPEPGGDNPSDKYTVTVVEAEHGFITVSERSAREGEVVTLRAFPKAGYEFAGWTVTSDNVTLDEPTANPVSFEMPAADVEFEAGFAQVQVPQEPYVPTPYYEAYVMTISAFFNGEPNVEYRFSYLGGLIEDIYYGPVGWTTPSAEFGYDFYNTSLFIGNGGSEKFYTFGPGRLQGGGDGLYVWSCEYDEAGNLSETMWMNDDISAEFTWTNGNMTRISTQLPDQEEVVVIDIEYGEVVNNPACNIDFNYFPAVYSRDNLVDPMVGMFRFYGTPSRNLKSKMTVHLDGGGERVENFAYTMNEDGYITKITQTSGSSMLEYYIEYAL